jgi:putative colanic acid biosynthesis acetyltransferase WcaF
MQRIIKIMVLPFLHILPETRCFGLKRALLRACGYSIGNNVRFCSSARIIGCGELSIGDNTWVGQETLIVVSKRVTIGSNVDIAPRVFIGDGTHEITLDKDRIADIETSKEITIGDGCWLCANSSILAGVSLGRQCVIAAGAVVTRSYENRLLIAGLPAMVKKQFPIKES